MVTHRNARKQRPGRSRARPRARLRLRWAARLPAYPPACPACLPPAGACKPARIHAGPPDGRRPLYNRGEASNLAGSATRTARSSSRSAIR